MQDNIFLSPHFVLPEFTESRTAAKHGIENVPGVEEVKNLTRLCEGTLEPLREVLGLPVIITSGYRCKRLNEILAHSARKSQHISGQAADFYVGQGQASGSKFQVLGHRELLIKAFHLIITDPKIDFDQVIIYPTFIHVSYASKVANRHKLTEGFGNGKYRNLTRADALSLV